MRVASAMGLIELRSARDRCHQAKKKHARQTHGFLCLLALCVLAVASRRVPRRPSLYVTERKRDEKEALISSLQRRKRRKEWGGKEAFGEENR